MQEADMSDGSGWTHYGEYLERCRAWEAPPQEGKFLAEADLERYMRLGGSRSWTHEVRLEVVTLLALTEGLGEAGSLSILAHIAKISFAAGMLAADEQRGEGR